MEEIYNKWQLQDLDLGNTEPYQFTKSELLDFAKYYHLKQLSIHVVVDSSVTISKQEYDALKRDSENLQKVSFSM